MSTRTSLNAYCLKNSCVLSRVNYTHFIAYLRFTNLRRYIYICEVEIQASLDDYENISKTKIPLLKKKHIFLQNEDYKGIEVKIIMSENDPANLRLYHI